MSCEIIPRNKQEKMELKQAVTLLTTLVTLARDNPDAFKQLKSTQQCIAFTLFKSGCGYRSTASAMGISRERAVQHYENLAKKGLL